MGAPAGTSPESRRVPASPAVGALADSLVPGSTVRAVLRHVRPVIDELLDGGARASASPLGFHYFTLRDADCDNVRLHVWPSGDRCTQTPGWTIHRHSRHLTSAVLVGPVTNRLFDVRARPGADRLLYEVVSGRPDTTLASTGVRVSCELACEQTFEEPSLYEVVDRDYHQTFVADGQLAATVARFRTARADARKSVVGSEWAGPVCYRRRQGNEAHARSLLLELRECLERP